jgi:hypothetical protein
MKAEERNNLVAPCGIDCGVCELYMCRDNPALYKMLTEKGISKEKIPCNGCRAVEGNCPVIHSQCETFSCTTDKNVAFCYECENFPCLKLHPSADRANILPHNLKVFNLCTIKNKGIENFIGTSGEIKRKYYKGIMEVGRGPQN